MVVSANGTRVRVKLPGAKGFSDVDATGEIPVGSVVDARKGRIHLQTALPGGGTQDAILRGATFAVRQGDAGMTEFALHGGSFAACTTPAASRSRASAARKRRRHHVVRSLWAADQGGLFQTAGVNSVATVRGTRWLTQDRCDGTLTRVKYGAVVVRDRVTGRVTVVTPGHPHLAPAAR